jgi:hypothetical protein
MRPWCRRERSYQLQGLVEEIKMRNNGVSFMFGARRIDTMNAFRARDPDREPA